jgi:hypothetical protein
LRMTTPTWRQCCRGSDKVSCRPQLQDRPEKPSDKACNAVYIYSLDSVRDCPAYPQSLTMLSPFLLRTITGVILIICATVVLGISAHVENSVRNAPCHVKTDACRILMLRPANSKSAVLRSPTMPLSVHSPSSPKSCLSSFALSLPNHSSPLSVPN